MSCGIGDGIAGGSILLLTGVGDPMPSGTPHDYCFYNSKLPISIEHVSHFLSLTIFLLIFVT